MTSMIRNTNNEDRDHVQNLDEITTESGGENLNREISEPSLESTTDNRDNCAMNMCHETVQEVSENAESESESDIEKKHIKRNPRFDRERHWADIWNIQQTLWTFRRHWANLLDIQQALGIFGIRWGYVTDIGQTFGRHCTNIGQTLGRHLADFGQTLSRLWADIGQTLGRLWADFGQTLGGHWANFGQTLGRHWGDNNTSIWQRHRCLIIFIITVMVISSIAVTLAVVLVPRSPGMS